jgi:hypothetical protein
MSDWTITGQSGQALGASSVDIDELACMIRKNLCTLPITRVST